MHIKISKQLVADRYRVLIIRVITYIDCKATRIMRIEFLNSIIHREEDIYLDNSKIISEILFFGTHHYW